MTFKAELPIVIDATQRSCFAECPQKFYKEFCLGLRPPGLSIDLHAGACFAAALEETYKGIYNEGLSLDDAILRSHARFLLEWGDFEIPDWKRTAKTKDRVWQAVWNPDGGQTNHGYFQEYPPHTDEVKPYRTSEGKPTMEYTFAIPLEPVVEPGLYTDEELRIGGYFPVHPSGQPFVYAGRFDMLGERYGRPIPRDEKTTGSSIGALWSKQWALRSQFIGYVWALQSCGIPAEEVCVRGIGIQKTQIVHAEMTQPYSKALIARWLEQLRRDLWAIRRAWDEGYWDYNFASACTSYGHCIFMDSCTSNDPEAWLNEMEIRRWNPLEKNPAKVEDPSAASAS